MKLKRFLSSLLTMSKAERNGTVVLVALLAIFILARFVLPTIFSRKDDDYLKEIELKISELEQKKDSIAIESKEQLANRTSTVKLIPTERKTIEKEVVAHQSVSYFKFDPNIASLDELLKLGFRAKTAQTLIKYREKGGKFFKPEELKKIYGVDSVLYAQLEPFISITPKPELSVKVDIMPKEPFGKLLVGINSADSTTWIKLKGIGSVYAKRICSFRESLGGFVAIEQIKEVYKLPEETYEGIKEQLVLDSVALRKINLNFASIDDLRKHPYCSYPDARKIVDYRADHGSYSSVEQLMNDSVLSPEVYIKLQPYLAVK